MRIDHQSLLREVRVLLQSLHRGTMSACAYDTAWVARLRRPDNPSALVFPSAADWLVAHQLDDGSWGAEGLLDRNAVQPRVRRGAAYLEQRAPALKDSLHETVGFELLFPPLLDRAHQLGISLPYSSFEWVRNLQRQKLRLIPRGLALQTTSLVHSLEALGEGPDEPSLPALQAPSGSLGNSPSATAHALNGAWGVFRGTCEETAYAVLALMRASPKAALPIRRGVEFLLDNRNEAPVPELWVGKGLYAPLLVVRSAVLSAILWYATQEGANCA